MKRVKSQEGFSLIELMMVVVIIGVLAGVGIPQYQRFQMKAKQSEAKSLLSAMYTSQKAFYAEWSRYYGDFNAVGYGLDGDLGYYVGFAVSTVGPTNHPNTAYSGRAATVLNAGTFCTAAGSCNTSNSRTTALPNNTTANQSVFRFGASANLDDDGTLDQWRINQDKDFAQVNDDIGS